MKRLGRNDLYGFVRDGKVASQFEEPRTPRFPSGGVSEAYIDTMSDLLLHEKLRDSAEEDEVRKIARVRTLTILARLDAHRKRSVLQFLDESGLIERGESIVNVRGADLSGVDLDTTPEPLEKVKSLQNATMPDGSTHAWQATL